MASHFGNDACPHGSAEADYYQANESQKAVVSSPAHALAKAQVLAEFLDGFGFIDIDAQDGKHLFDRAVGGLLACRVVALFVFLRHVVLHI